MKIIIFIFVLLVGATFIVSNQALAQSEWTGNINVFYGFKTINSDDWSIESDDMELEDAYPNAKVSVDKAKEFGINLDFGQKSWPVCVTVGYLNASGDDKFSGGDLDAYISDDYDVYLDEGTPNGVASGNAKLEVKIHEIRLGAKKIFEATPIIRPYIAGGLTQISAEGKIHVGYDLAFNDGSYSESGTITSGKDDDSAIGVWISGGVYWTLIDHLNAGVEVSYSKGTVDLGKDLEAGGLHYGLFVGYHW